MELKFLVTKEALGCPSSFSFFNLLTKLLGSWIQTIRSTKQFQTGRRMLISLPSYWGELLRSVVLAIRCFLHSFLVLVFWLFFFLIGGLSLVLLCERKSHKWEACGAFNESCEVIWGWKRKSCSNHRAVSFWGILVCWRAI